MRTWQKALRRHLLIWTGVAGIGLASGRPLEAFLLLFLGYALRHYYQLYRFSRWLFRDSAEPDAEPPESYGLWGEIYDGIYRLQKRERKASAHLENIIDKAQQSSAALEMAVVMINGQGLLAWWNQAAEDLLGLQFPQDRNQAITNLIRNPDFHDYFHAQEFDETLKMPAPADAKRFLEFQIALFGEGERLLIARDITQLERLANMRKDFVANVSHELGTPITVIKGYLEAIIENSDAMDPRWHKALTQMQQQSLRMENIVRDLLLLASLENRAPEQDSAPVDVAELIGAVEIDTRQMFLDKSHRFEVDCEAGLTLLGSRQELYSAISNLVVNAAKYTPAKGEIRLQAGLSGGGCQIAVIDNGNGIEKHHLPRLTERFYRVDNSRSTESGGTGLGLAIVKHILSRHGATLAIESELGRGSRFMCNFPSSRTNTGAAPPLQGKAPVIDGDRIEAKRS